MRIKLNKNETLVNFGNSILSNYECETFHKTYQNLDEILKTHKNKKVCLILLDGFGKAIIEKYKENCPFIYKHSCFTFYSTYPPTTVAATNALLLAKYPCETGFVGWSQYFKEHDQIIDVFPSVNSLTRERVSPHVCDTILKENNIVEIINKNNKYKAQQLMGFNYLKENHEYDLQALFNAADTTLNDFDFTYIYSSEPDHAMHDYGVINEHVKNKVIELDKLIENLTEKHKDTLFLIIADHGMIDTTPVFIDDIPGFKESIYNEIPLFEGRFAGFFVKNEENFLSAYYSFLESNFILMSKKEILENNVFGYSTNYKKTFIDGMADYYLISKTDACFARGRDYLIGNHAGGTQEEIEINLSVINYEKRP